MAKLLWKLKNQMDRDQEDEEEETQKSYICPYCQKKFFCAKDYVRHKRSCHLWNNNINNENKAAIVVDLSKALPRGWLKTRKRGTIKGKSPICCAPIVDDDDDDDEQSLSSHDAAINLLALANNAVPARETLPPKKRKWSDSSSAAPEKLKSKKKMDESHGQQNLPPEKRKRSSPQEKLIRIESPCSDKWLKNQPHDHDDENGKGKAMAIVVSADNDNDNAYTTLTPHKHVCSICNRCFSSYQAMGGHKAHHGRKDDDYEPPLSPRRDHECPICRETFSKGQALGGHKRHCNAAARLNEASHGGSGEVNKMKMKKRLLRQALCFDVSMQAPTRNGQQKKDGKVMGIQETLSLPWHEDGSEQDTFSYNSSSN